jgi:hypothetical protein
MFRSIGLFLGTLVRILRVRRSQPTSKEFQELIFRMVVENSTWGAPRIHGELLMLGMDVSERTISRWMKRAPRDPEPARRWLTFLGNHRKVIAAMDFFTVPTITFSALYCFFVIRHDRRRILHFNITSIRQAHGSCSGCEKHFHLDPLRGLIVMPSMDWKSRQRFDP